MLSVRLRSPSSAGLLVAAVLAASCRESPPAPRAGPTEATLSVVLPSSALVRGEHPTILLRILNRSPQPLWVNGRMLVASRDEVEPFHEVWLEITAPDGQAVPFDCRIRAGDAEPRHYRSLLPGAAHEREAELRCFDFEQVGRYKLIAHYRDGSDLRDGDKSVPPPPPPGATHLAGDLTSEPVFLEVTDKP